MKQLSTTLLICLLLLAGCKSDDDMGTPNVTTPPNTGNGGTGDPDPGSTNDDYVVETIIPTGEEQFLNLDSDYIFDQDKLHTFELNLPKESLTRINDDPTAEEYVEGALTFEGETISPVGIRYKGSIGAFVGCVSGNNWAEPSGYKTCTKLSMKIKINWDGSETKFYGLKKLQLHSQNNDPSQMYDRLGYWLFRSMGVPAPRAIHARLLINGEYAGLFALVEQIDGRFTRYNYADGEGNLYKEIWPLSSNGQAFPESTYLEYLKTNEDDNPSNLLIKAFGEEVANASPDDLQSVIENRMDIDEIISYAAVDRTIRNDDGAFHWYCGGNQCSPHNFYWYEEPNNGKLHLIPWDLDHAFANIITNSNPVTPIADGWGETSNNCQPFSSGFFGLQQWSAACDKLTGGWASYEEEYAQKTALFKSTFLSESQTDALLDQWSSQIRAATLEAHEMHGDAISPQEWELAVLKLKSQLEHARNN